MPLTEEREIRRSRSGMLVVVVLAVIFFVLLAFIIHGVKRRSDASSRPATSTVFVIPLRLRIRAEPSAKAAVVAIAEQGEKLNFLEAQGAWGRVLTAKNVEGWAERSALEEQEERDRRTARIKNIRALPPLNGLALEKAALYSGPGLFYSVVGQLEPKAKLRVFTRDHDFYAVELGSDIAYAEVDSIDLTSGGDTNVEVAAQETKHQAPNDTAPTESSAEIPEQSAVELPNAPAQEQAPSSAVYPSVPAGGTEPRVLSRVVPDYPAAARARGTEGTVILRAIVRSDGSVDDVMVIRDQPNGLGDSAADAVRRWRFRPATLNGAPIDVYYTVTVNFKLSS